MGTAGLAEGYASRTALKSQLLWFKKKKKEEEEEEERKKEKEKIPGGSLNNSGKLRPGEECPRLFIGQSSALLKFMSGGHHFGQPCPELAPAEQAAWERRKHIPL
jgi:hypothetical protein